MNQRKPMAIANWKMAMTVSEGLAFVKSFLRMTEAVLRSVDVVLCPPFTSVYPLSQALSGSPIELGAQNVFIGPGAAHTGEISAPLLAEAGCKWVMVGHWEVRRRTGETDKDVHHKIHAAFDAGLRPIVLVGEKRNEKGQAEKILKARLPHLFGDLDPAQSAQVSIIYEPEWTIGAENPAPPDTIASACGCIRKWLDETYGTDAANAVRLIYGGSVAPDNVEALLASPDIDGLGAGRTGRDPDAFARIVQKIAAAKGLA